MKKNKRQADNCHGRDPIIQRAVGVEKGSSEEIEFIRFIGVIVTRVSQQQGWGKTKRCGNPTRKSTWPLRESKHFHGMNGVTMHPSKGHAKRASKKPCPLAKAWFKPNNQQTIKLSLERALEEWLADHVLEFLENFELPIGLGLTNENILGEVVVLLGSDRAARTIEGNA